MRKLPLIFGAITLCCCILAACNPVVDSPTPTATPQPEVLPAFTPTPEPTREPAIAEVNGEVISVANFEAELVRYKAAQSALGIAQEDEAAARSIVLQELIDQVLLAQAAAESGFIVDDAMLQARLTTLVEKAGGADQLNAWMAENFYTETSFAQALKRQIAAAWQRDQIIASVPGTAEQIHAREIRLSTRWEADDMLYRLNTGTSFETLAWQADPFTGGDLSWFPRGYLTVPAVEEAAFALQPGYYTEVIETELGFHIVMVLEYDEAHPLATDALQFLQRKALNDWMAQRRAGSTINLY